MVVIGIEPGWAGKIVNGIRKTGKPVEGFWIERNGDHKTIMSASKKAREFTQWASEKQRVICNTSE